MSQTFVPISIPTTMVPGIYFYNSLILIKKDQKDRQLAPNYLDSDR